MFAFRCNLAYTPSPLRGDFCLLVEDGRLVGRLDYEECVRAHPGIDLVDLRGKAVGPGLIDLHCHGAMNADFADGTPDDFRAAAGYHLAHGTTTMLAAIGSCTTAEMLAACRTARRVRQELPNLYGVHLEGPYFSREHFGCHLAEMIRDPEPTEWKQFEDYADVVREITLAPELPGALDLIGAFASWGILCSIGHSNACYDTIEQACGRGLRHSTHVFCAMPPAHRVDYVLQPGVLETVFMRDDLTTEAIGDAIHVGPRLVEFVHKVKGTANLALVSDALRGAGCPPGEYAFGTRGGKMCRLIDSPRVGVVPDRPGVLASSAITLSDTLRILPSVTALSLATVWEMASLTPARILGLEKRKGSLAIGKDADLLVLNEDATADAVYVGGKRI